MGVFDLVTAAYLLVHATSRDQLAAMCQAIVKQLKPGGRFVALTINPQLVPDQLPRIEHYHSGVTVQGPLYDGAPLDVTMLTASGPLHLRDYYWSQDTYESVLHQVGFEDCLACHAGLGGRLARVWERLLARLSHPSAYRGLGSPERHA